MFPTLAAPAGFDATPDGLMAGSYTMATVAGESFEAEIPAFSLDVPHSRRVMH